MYSNCLQYIFERQMGFYGMVSSQDNSRESSAGMDFVGLVFWNWFVADILWGSGSYASRMKSYIK